MRLTDIAVTDSPRGARLSGVAVWERGSPDAIEFVYRDLPAAALTDGTETMLASMLLPAMAVGEDVRLEKPVSARLLRRIEKIVRINVEWFPRLHATRVEAPSRESPREGATVGSFFSGGVDSFYSALRDRAVDPVELLISIVGFDLRFEKRAFATDLMPRLEKVASELGRRFLVVDSNAYEIGHKYLTYAEHHGAFLAAVALGLRELRTCYIPASWTLWRTLPPYGSHPATDPLWSTETLEIVHDGVEMSRTEKAFEIASNQVVLDHLRVCVRRPDLYNCGRCEKCVSAALTLQVAGTIGRCATLKRVTPRTIRWMRTGVPYDVVFRELLGYARDPEIRRALATALRRGRLYRVANPVVGALSRRRLRGKVRRFEMEAAG